MHKLQQRYRYSFILLKQLVKTDFKLRYQGSVLGYVWSLLKPLFLFATLYFVFARFLRFGDSIPHYPQYLLLGILLWNYFTEVTVGSVGAIVGKGDLLRKINFPKYVIILAGSFSAFINLILNFIVLGLFMAYGHIGLTRHALLIIPLVAELFIFALALAFFLSALFVKFRDITYIWEVAIQAAFYATPILYPLIGAGAKIPHEVAKLMLLNPMAQIIQDARYALINPDSSTATISTLWGGDRLIWGIPLGISLITVLLAATYFRNQSKFFAEEV